MNSSVGWSPDGRQRRHSPNDLDKVKSRPNQNGAGQKHLLGPNSKSASNSPQHGRNKNGRGRRNRTLSSSKSLSDINKAHEENYEKQTNTSSRYHVDRCDGQCCVDYNKSLEKKTPHEYRYCKHYSQYSLSDSWSSGDMKRNKRGAEKGKVGGAILFYEIWFHLHVLSHLAFNAHLGENRKDRKQNQSQPRKKKNEKENKQKMQKNKTKTKQKKQTNIS